MRSSGTRCVWAWVAGGEAKVVGRNLIRVGPVLGLDLGFELLVLGFYG